MTWRFRQEFYYLLKCPFAFHCNLFQLPSVRFQKQRTDLNDKHLTLRQEGVLVSNTAEVCIIFSPLFVLQCFGSSTKFANLVFGSKNWPEASRFLWLPDLTKKIIIPHFGQTSLVLKSFLFKVLWSVERSITQSNIWINSKSSNFCRRSMSNKSEDNCLGSEPKLEETMQKQAEPSCQWKGLSLTTTSLLVDYVVSYRRSQSPWCFFMSALLPSFVQLFLMPRRLLLFI